MNVQLGQVPWHLSQQLKYTWSTGATNGRQYLTCDLDTNHLFVVPEPHSLYSFSVADEEGNIIRSEYDFPDAESAVLAAESRWKSCSKPVPRMSGKGQTFKWNTVEKGSASECRIGMKNSILLQTFRDEESGFWSYCAYCQNVLLLEELEECTTNEEAQLELEKWYKFNAVHLLNVHFLPSK